VRLSLYIRTSLLFYQLLTLVFTFSRRALEDGDITISDAFDLVSKLATVLDVSTKFKGPDFTEFLRELSEENLIIMEEI